MQNSLNNSLTATSGSNTKHEGDKHPPLNFMSSASNITLVIFFIRLITVITNPNGNPVSEVADTLTGMPQDNLVHFSAHQKRSFEMICIQKTWFDCENVMQIPNHICEYRNRVRGIRGGCAMYVHSKMNYSRVHVQVRDYLFRNITRRKTYWMLLISIIHVKNWTWEY